MTTIISDTTQREAPDLSGRMARCSCTVLRPSSTGLPFFECRGPGSRDATEHCECGYHRIAHEIPERAARLKCKQFKPRGPRELDVFYCGHGGWD